MAAPAAPNPGCPSRTLKHLIRARTATCPAPGCGAQACHCDLDHTLAYPAGPTDECNLAPPCRRHHRAKQAPGWQLEQPEPGVMGWTTPSRRVHTTLPTIYETSDQDPGMTSARRPSCSRASWSCVYTGAVSELVAGSLPSRRAVRPRVTRTSGIASSGTLLIRAPR
jgi:hypothetical protein